MLSLVRHNIDIIWFAGEHGFFVILCIVNFMRVLGLLAAVDSQRIVIK